MADDNLLEHVADIVSAHVSNNSVAMADLAGLISSVYSSLSGLGQPAAPVEEERTPAVSVRASVKPDVLTCLDCGAKMKMLKRHVMTDHGLTPAQYRERWNLPASYPMVAADYSARRKELALSIGLGRKPGQKVKPISKAAAKTKLAAPKAKQDAAKAKPVAPKKSRQKSVAKVRTALAETPVAAPEAQAAPTEV